MENIQISHINEISPNLHLIELNNEKKIYLIGTAHVSAQSAQLVKDTIEQIEPDTICIELDPQRYKNLKNKNQFENIDIIEIIKKKQFFFFMSQLLLSTFQKKIARQTQSEPGKEFKVAYQLAEEKQLRLELIDRNIGVTLKRAWRLTHFFDKLKLLGSAFLGENNQEIEEINIEAMKSNDAINTMLETFSRELPACKQVLIDERDLYLAHQIKSKMGTTTVAVVGAGHVNGIINHLKQPISQEAIETIDTVPPPSLFSKILPWIIPVLVIGLFIWGFFTGEKEVAQGAVIFWILINGTLTSLGCLLALGHPITIISGFIAAPITSLNPMIGAGLVTALVQTFFSKPRVKDFMQIHDHELKLADYWKNRLTKILLVFIFSSLGSMIGTFIGLPIILRLFQ